MDEQLAPNTNDQNEPANSLATTEPVTSSFGPSRRWFSPKIISLLILVALTIGLAIWLLATNNQPQANKQPYYKTYNSLEDFKISNAGTNTSVSFKKPPELAPLEPRNGILDFSQNAPGNTKVVISDLSVKTNNLAADFSKSDLDKINAALAKPGSSEYKVYSQPLTSFLIDGMNPRFTLSLGQAAPFTNQSIKNNAWQFDISLIDNTAQAAKDYSKAFAYQGKIIYAIGQSKSYYFALVTLDYNWQPNISTWNSMFDSLMIDQSSQ